jgi:transcriptional regulator with XRE-family HTH domain
LKACQRGFSISAAISLERNLLCKGDVRLEKETFGPVLRAARERKGVSLKQLAAETKLSAELWESLEENDLSRWPKRVFARSYVRDYATRVGLDADETVNEFCRLFPEWGDRRAERVIREKAQIIAHDLEWEDLPSPHQRRATDRANGQPLGFLVRHRVRVLGTAIDALAMFGPGLVGLMLGANYWVSTAIAASAYSLVSTALLGRSGGLVASEWLLRTLGAMPAARRLQSSRAQSA